MGTWPGHYPDACPPEGAVEPHGTRYRFVKKKTIQARDFESRLEQYISGARFQDGKDWDDSEDCMASGLSVYATKEAAERKRGSTGGMRRLKLAEGDVTGLGRIADTPPKNTTGHQTWWVPNGVDPVDIFTVVDP